MVSGFIYRGLPWPSFDKRQTCKESRLFHSCKLALRDSWST